MNITKEYLPDQGIVVLTVECHPLPTTRHTIIASALANGTISLGAEIARLTNEANERLNTHNIVMGIINE